MALAYTEPRVNVNQVFTPQAPVTGLIARPGGIIGPAYGAYAKESLGDCDGVNIKNETLAWTLATGEKIIFDTTVAGAAIYNFYPTKVYCQPSGEIARIIADAEITKIAATLAFLHDAGTDTKGVNGEARFPVNSDFNRDGGVQATDQGFMPYVKSDITTALGAADTILYDTDVNFIALKIQPGQTIRFDGAATATVLEVLTATSIQMASAPGAHLVNVDYSIGSDAFDGIYMEDFFDPAGEFLTNSVRIGDVLKITTNQGLAAAEVSIKRVMKETWVKVNIAEANSSALNTIYSMIDAAPLATTHVASAYLIERYFFKPVTRHGFTAAGTSATNVITFTDVPAAQYAREDDIVLILGVPHKITAADATTITVDGTVVNGAVVVTMFTACGVVQADTTQILLGPVVGPTAATVLLSNVQVGDIVTVYEAGVITGTTVNQATVEGINTVTKTITISEVSDLTAADNVAIGIYNASTTIESAVTATYRAAKTAIAGSKIEITKEDDITDNLGDITPFNDLAQATANCFRSSGGRTCYAFPTDITETEADEYAAALEAAGDTRIYSFVPCSQTAAVLALFGPAVNSRSTDVEALWSRAYLSMNWDTIMKITNGIATGGAAGQLTDSAADFIGDGIVIGDDLVENGVTYKITSLDTTNIYMSGTTNVFAATDVYVINTGNKTPQATKLGAVSEGYANRRISNVFAGGFTMVYGVDDNGADVEYDVPDYFIGASIAGIRSLVSASQPLSNYGVGTFQDLKYSNKYFNRTQLNIIAGGGTLIVTQQVTTGPCVCRDGITTDRSDDTMEEEISTVSIDAVSYGIYDLLDSYKGKHRMTTPFLQFIFGVLSNASEKYVKDLIVEEMQIVSVAKASTGNKTVECLFRAKVFDIAKIFDVTITV